MKFIRILTVVLIAVTLSTIAPADEASMKKDAQAAGEQWLALIDGSKYADSYDAAAPMFKAALTKADWQKALIGVRTPLGKNESRQLATATYATSLPGAPDGKYMVMQFNTSFQNKKEAIETLTMVLGDDGQWRSIGYFIK
jgi:Protein of unknown function (DUF4019)